MAEVCPKDRYLRETPMWAVAIVCFVIVAVSIVIEHIIHIIGHWLTKKHKVALYEALEKVKAELMLLGFISLLLTVLQDHISKICIPERVADTWHPCTKDDNKKLNAKDKLVLEETLVGRRHLSDFDSYESVRRILAAAGPATCGKGKVPLVSSYAIHQLHIFIFVLAVFHILYCITTLSLSRAKMKRWQLWEKETRTVEYEFSHDPERFRFARETTFGRRHFSYWSKSPILLWIVCFFRQFTGAVKKVDYLTLRHGFIMAHLAPQSATKFDFQKYIKRSLDEDFKVVVGISPPIWFLAVLLLLFNTHGWYTYLWLPFIPLIIILLVSTKLQVIITKMGLRIQDRGDVVRGDLTVEPADDYFWFSHPRFVLFLINFVLFQNAFQLAFFAYTTYEFGLRSCFHKQIEDIIIRISMGVLVQFICSYVTLPLYALVTQMGSNMRPTIFNERVAGALRKWHHTARKHVKHNRQSKGGTPTSSMPSTPRHGMSPVHLLSNYQGRADSAPVSPRTAANWEYNENWESEGSPFPSHHGIGEQDREAIEMGLSIISLPPSQDDNGHEHETGTGSRDQHSSIHMGPASKEFSFDKRSRV